MAAQFEEIVADADWPDVQHLGPELGQVAFEGGARSDWLGSTLPGRGCRGVADTLQNCLRIAQFGGDFHVVGRFMRNRSLTIAAPFVALRRGRDRAVSHSGRLVSPKP